MAIPCDRVRGHDRGHDHGHDHGHGRGCGRGHDLRGRKQMQ